jgi:hypothetical protein
MNYTMINNNDVKVEEKVEEQVDKCEKAKHPEVNLLEVLVTDENTALNVVVGFVFLAHKRGVFTLEEAAKIWECVKKFQKSG